MAQGQVPGQPNAQNMREMVWDEELAAKAQQWANQCTFEHDPSRYLGSNFIYFLLLLNEQLNSDLMFETNLF